MFDYLIEENEKLEKEFIKFLPEKVDRDFIKELIHPKKLTDKDAWSHKGRVEDKSFLYEVISGDELLDTCLLLI